MSRINELTTLPTSEIRAYVRNHENAYAGGHIGVNQYLKALDAAREVLKTRTPSNEVTLTVADIQRAYQAGQIPQKKKITFSDLVGLILSDVPLNTREAAWVYAHPDYRNVSAFVNEAYGAGLSKEVIASKLDSHFHWEAVPLVKMMARV